MVPAPIENVILRWWTRIRQPFVKVVFFGRKHYCPICRSHARTFFPCGNPPRPNARCPICHSLERHRLDWLFFRQETNLFDTSPKRMLHVGPEPCFESRLKRIDNLDYLTADLHNPRAMVKMDITAIQFPDNSFDVIYCSHILEHVPDDHKAIREFYRVLKPGGWAVLQVPVVEVETTFEDPTITSPQERERVFGQHDHVRRCGPDYINRMAAAGFNTTTFCATDVIDAASLFRLGVQQGRLIFFCTK